MKGKPIKNLLVPEEVMAIGLGLSRLIEDMETVNKDGNIPWTPEAILIQGQILSNARSAAKKIEQMTGFVCKLDPYKEGDENEFLTKQS